MRKQNDPRWGEGVPSGVEEDKKQEDKISLRNALNDVQKHKQNHNEKQCSVPGRRENLIFGSQKTKKNASWMNFPQHGNVQISYYILT